MGKDISKRYVIKLSEGSEKVKAGGQEISKRDAEIGMLSSMFDAAAIDQKSIKIIAECGDCIEQLDNLSDDECEIIFTSTDIDRIKEGFKSDKIGRSLVWTRLTGLLRQLESPQEAE